MGETNETVDPGDKHRKPHTPESRAQISASLRNIRKRPEYLSPERSPEDIVEGVRCKTQEAQEALEGFREAMGNLASQAVARKESLLDTKEKELTKIDERVSEGLFRSLVRWLRRK